MNVDIEAVLKNIVRIGSVSSVDVVSRTVRVAFADKQDADGKSLISGALKVLQNQPLITVEKWVEENGALSKWNLKAEYNSHDRDLKIGEKYIKSDYSMLKDVIENDKTIKYEKRETISGGSPIHVSCTGTAGTCPLKGILENKNNKEKITVYPWLPYVGQFVVCLYLPNGESDGFVIGGI